MNYKTDKNQSSEEGNKEQENLEENNFLSVLKVMRKN